MATNCKGKFIVNFYTSFISFLTYILQIKKTFKSQKKKNTKTTKKKHEPEHCTTKQTQSVSKPTAPDLEDATWEVEEIRGFKKIKNKIHLKIKWVNCPASQNTWEPMKQILGGWDVDRKKIYEFFKTQKIKVSGCDQLDLVTGRIKKPK